VPATSPRLNTSVKRDKYTHRPGLLAVGNLAGLGHKHLAVPIAKVVFQSCRPPDPFCRPFVCTINVVAAPLSFFLFVCVLLSCLVPRHSPLPLTVSNPFPASHPTQQRNPPPIRPDGDAVLQHKQQQRPVISCPPPSRLNFNFAPRPPQVSCFRPWVVSQTESPVPDSYLT